MGNKPMHPITSAVISSSVADANYDEGTKIFTVKFNSGSTYAYRHVPLDIVKDFFSSTSKGQFIHTQLKGKFEHRKV